MTMERKHFRASSRSHTHRLYVVENGRRAFTQKLLRAAMALQDLEWSEKHEAYIPRPADRGRRMYRTTQRGRRQQDTAAATGPQHKTKKTLSIIPEEPEDLTTAHGVEPHPTSIPATVPATDSIQPTKEVSEQQSTKHETYWDKHEQAAQEWLDEVEVK